MEARTKDFTLLSIRELTTTWPFKVKATNKTSIHPFSIPVSSRAQGCEINMLFFCVLCQPCNTECLWNTSFVLVHLARRRITCAKGGIFETFHNVFEKLVKASTTQRPPSPQSPGQLACVCGVDGVRLTVLSREGGGPGTSEVPKVFVPLDS